MEFFLLSVAAGFLTLLSPCVLPVLPVILGASVQNPKTKLLRQLVIIASLVLSIIIFTLLLKAGSLLINIPQELWQIFSGGIIAAYGLLLVFPDLWDRFNIKLKLSYKSDQLLNNAGRLKGSIGDILIGASLGPVFASCSPTYSIILATVLPVSFSEGLFYLMVYSFSLGLGLFVIVVLGHKATNRLKWWANPKSVFKKFIGIIFIVIGLLILTGLERKLELWLLENGFAGTTWIESRLVESLNLQMSDNPNPLAEEDLFNVDNPYEASDFGVIDQWIGTSSISLSELRGKVVLVDFWTYSCINCLRTLPILKTWNEKYKSQGLVIVGIHAPEFAFEKVYANVEKAVGSLGIEYPVGLDNDFVVWRSYNNQYWPAKYFIDATGNVRHTHFGEGDDEHSEKVIQALLEEANAVELDFEIGKYASPPLSQFQSPETYLGYLRGSGFANDQSETKFNTESIYKLADSILINQWSLDGRWTILDEKSTCKANKCKLAFRFNAKDVYLVISPEQGESEIKLRLNSDSLAQQKTGEKLNENGEIEITESRLYHLVKLDKLEQDQLLEIELNKGLSVHAFTFGS